MPWSDTSLIGIQELVVNVGFLKAFSRLEDLCLSPFHSPSLLFLLPFIGSLSLETGPLLFVLDQFHVAGLIGSQEALGIHLIGHICHSFGLLGSLLSLLKILLQLLHPSQSFSGLLSLQCFTLLVLRDLLLGAPSVCYSLHQRAAVALND